MCRVKLREVLWADGNCDFYFIRIFNTILKHYFWDLEIFQPLFIKQGLKGLGSAGHDKTKMFIGSKVGIMQRIGKTIGKLKGPLSQIGETPA